MDVLELMRQGLVHNGYNAKLEKTRLNNDEWQPLTLFVELSPTDFVYLWRYWEGREKWGYATLCLNHETAYRELSFRGAWRMFSDHLTDPKVVFIPV